MDAVVAEDPYAGSAFDLIDDDVVILEHVTFVRVATDDLAGLHKEPAPRTRRQALSSRVCTVAQSVAAV